MSRFASALLLLAAGAPLRAQSLVPAGNINSVFSQTPVVFLTHDDPAVLRSVSSIRDSYFKGAEILTTTLDEKALAGKTLLVYATPEHPFLRAHQNELPFAYGERSLEVDGRKFTGEHLRLIAAVHNPADRTRSAVFYTAASAADLVGINGIFHGPTEWVVADGKSPLASGAFLSGITLEPQAMASDLERLVASIAEVHPSAVEKLPADVEAAAATARKAIAKPLGRLEFGRVLAEVLAALHDAHSALALPRSGETVALPFVWLEEGLIVSADAGELRRGDRILSLAGRDAAALDAALAAVVPAENPYWRRQLAPGLLSDLGVLALLSLPARPPLELSIERDGKETSVAVPAGPLPTGAERPDWVRYAIEKEHSLGIFTLDRCAADAHYLETLEKFFRAVHEQGLRRIAVDLRANSGGNSQVCPEFLRYLDIEGYRDFSGDVRWSKTALAQRKESGAPRFEPAQEVRQTNQRRADPPPFRGELFLLVGPATFSSGSWFAAVVQDNKLGKLVGEPTGNAPSSYGDILSLSLPASGCSYTLSFKRWRRPDRSRDPAITLVPDVPVPRTRASIAAGTDPVLDWLRAH